MAPLNTRQEMLLKFLEKQGSAGIAQFLTALKEQEAAVPKITVNRDLKKLIRQGLMLTEGRGRAVIYRLSPEYNLQKWIDPEVYFAQETDQRQGKTRFSFDIFNFLKNPFTEEEQKKLEALQKEYEQHLKAFSFHLLQKEFERLTIEFSWKSSRIEGNTYTLLETEQLLRQKEEAPGHKAEEAKMILGHKQALDYIHAHSSHFKKISVKNIEETHALLVKGLPISKGLRKGPVGIVGTRYRPLDNWFQIKENLEKACDVINAEKNPFAKALLAVLLISYLQPFTDGNKRASRMAGNALMLAYGLCPLSYRSVNEIEYKKAMILFYEQNNLSYFKKLFFEQIEFAVKNYFIAEKK